MKFTGHERDLGLNGQTTDDLDYMHARHYSLHLGRFLSTDPVGGSIGSSQSWNRYSYVVGNPINGTDPTGMLVNNLGGPGDMPVNLASAGTGVTAWDAGFSSVTPMPYLSLPVQGGTGIWVGITNAGDVSIMDEQLNPIEDVASVGAALLQRIGSALRRIFKDRLGGTVVNLLYRQPVVVSASRAGGGQEQFIVLPGKMAGAPFVDVDAVYFSDGGVLKISNMTIFVVYDIKAMKHWNGSRPFLSGAKLFGGSYGVKYLPNLDAARREFGGPIVPGIVGFGP
ncbi:MAG: RHS repeat-associated core domain-containing protein [Calditrichaeota bacterium]|nr:RHS repeat-associated core domain-containing protein [Calditrichota bacterium]